MITKQDLDEAIAECQGQRNPNANTCIKLASFFIIRRELFKEDKEDEQFSQPMFSYSSGENIIGRYGDSEFLEAVDGKPIENVMLVMNELMDSMQVLQPRIYDSVMRKVSGL